MAGPSNIAAAAHNEAAFEQFCPSVIQPGRNCGALNALWTGPAPRPNPECFNPDGTWKKGAKARNRPKRYQAFASKRRERERRLAAERKRCHGELANRILGQGTTVKPKSCPIEPFSGLGAEDLGQRTWGSGLGAADLGQERQVRAAGMFVGILRTRLKAGGGELIEFGTKRTCLSRFCHVGRDLYCAFVARSSQKTILTRSRPRGPGQDVVAPGATLAGRESAEALSRFHGQTVEHGSPSLQRGEARP